MQYNRVMSLSNGTCIKIDNSLTYRVKSITFELEKGKKYEDHINISKNLVWMEMLIQIIIGLKLKIQL